MNWGLVSDQRLTPTTTPMTWESLGMLFVNTFTNKLCDDGIMQSTKRPNPRSFIKDINLGMHRSGDPFNPHTPFAHFHVSTQRQWKRSGIPTRSSTLEVGLVCILHNFIAHALGWYQGVGIPKLGSSIQLKRYSCSQRWWGHSNHWR